MDTQNPAGDGPVPPAGTHGPGATSPGAPPPGTATGQATGFFASLRGTGLYRSDERWIGGVAGGLAARFGLDPLLVRGLFLVTLLLGGFGLVIYAIGWALLPERRDGRIHLEGLVLGHPDVALLGALGMLLLGVGRGAVDAGPFHTPGWLQGMFWLGAVVLLIVLVATLASRRPSSPRPYAAQQPYGPPPAGTPYAGAPYPGAPYPGAPFTGPAGTAPTGAPAAGPIPPTPPQPTAATYAAAPSRGASSVGAPPPAWGPTPPPPPRQPYRYVAAPPPPPPAPAPPRAPRRGPGASTVGVTVAMSLFVVAGVLIAQRTGWLDRPMLGTAAALIVLMLGVAIVVSGLRGRTGGVLGFLAVVAMIVATPIAVVSRADWDFWEPAPNAVQVGEGTTVLDTRAEAERGVEIGWGDATVDLSDVPLDGSEPLTVPISFRGGNLTVVVPEGVAASGDVSIGAGQVRWNVGSDDETWSGVAISKQDFGVADDEAELHLKVSALAGDVTIEEE